MAMDRLFQASPGIVMNFVCVAIEIAMLHLLGSPLFNLGTFPNWAAMKGGGQQPRTLNGSAAIGRAVPPPLAQRPTYTNV